MAIKLHWERLKWFRPQDRNITTLFYSAFLTGKVVHFLLVTLFSYEEVFVLI